MQRFSIGQGKLQGALPRAWNVRFGR